MTRETWPAWPDRVVARYPLWRREALLLFPLSLLAILTPNAARITGWADLLQWCLVALGAALAGWIYIAAFSSLFLRLFHRLTSPVSKTVWVMAAGGGTGVAFALGTYVGIALMGLPDAEPLWWRIVATAIIIGWLGIALTLTLDARTRLRGEREQLLDEAIALESAQLTTGAIVDEMREDVSREIDMALKAARSDIDRQLAGDGLDRSLANWPDVAESLRRTASETVRPLSRDLWDSASSVVERPRPWSILAYVIAHQPFRPLAACIVYVLGGGAALLQQGDPTSATTELGVGVAIIAITMSVANAAMRRLPRLHAVIFVLASLLLQLLVIINATIRRSGEGADASSAGLIATVLAGLVVILATSTFGAVRSMTQEQLDDIAAAVNEDFIEATARSHVLAGVLREAGSVMHGSVQARLLSCAIAVEEAGQSQDAERFSLALARAREELEYPLPSLGSAPPASLREVLERHRSLWEGLCEVSYEIADDLPDLPPRVVLACGRIVEEGISNAVRHGDAQGVAVRVASSTSSGDPVSQRLHITVSDDGRGLAGISPAPGLGLRMIQSTATAWSLRDADGMTQLSVELPTT